MPGFAKFLAVMNVLAAGLFIYLAALDWQKRNEWAYEVFRRELIIYGLPINEEDASWRVDRPVRRDLSRATTEDMFRNAGKEPVYTQIEEVKRIQEELKKQIEELPNEKAKKDRLRQAILNQAPTIDDRLEQGKKLEDASLDDWWKAFDQAFENVARLTRPDDPNYDLGKAREAIAHLLCNLSSDTAHQQRAMVVVGLRPYIREAELQATNLREMANRLRSMMVSDRTQFESEYGQLLLRLGGLTETIDQMSEAVKAKQELVDLARVDHKKRVDDKATLEAKLNEMKIDRGKSLSAQRGLEKSLFHLNAELGLIKEQTENLELELRRLERAGGR